jgi:transcriptional/translational regulatory protein YebC/TACO1
MEIALEAGADDLKHQGDVFEITCDPAHFNTVKTALEARNVATTNGEITQMPKVSVDTDLESARKVMAILENLDDHDDVQNVYSNLNLTDEVLAGVENG